MEKASDKVLLLSIAAIGILWLLLIVIQRSNPTPPVSFPPAMLQPLDKNFDSGVLDMIKKQRGL